MLKKLLNSTEAIVNERLRAVCVQHSANVHVKVRIADVLEIQQSGVSNSEYSYALKAHFDFVVVDSGHFPLFAVEFDGPRHGDPEQIGRDAIKDRLCSRFNLPILRCRDAHLSMKLDGWDLLSWLVDVWFIRDAADRMQERGELPYDFDLDPALIMNSPDRAGAFPYWLGQDAQRKLESLANAGRIPIHAPRVLCVGIDDKSTWRGFGSLEVADGLYVSSFVSMRSQAFPVSLVDPIQGLLLADIGRQVDQFLRTSADAKSLEIVDCEWLKVRTGTRLVSCFTSADVPMRP